LNKEELLSEGYLIPYITGELSESEHRDVELLIESDAEVQMEYAGLQRTIERIAFKYAITPSEAVKKYVMQNQAVMRHLPPTSDDSSKWRLLAAASISATVIASASAWYFWNSWKDTDLKLAQVTSRNIEMAERYSQASQELDEIRNDLAVIVSPEFSRIILNGTDKAKNANVVIYWNAEEEEVFLNSSNLAQLPQHQQYQLWALIDGKPIDAGVFDAASGKFQIMKNIAAADAFAVTVESKGGAESPTLSTMQVYGETKS